MLLTAGCFKAMVSLPIRAVLGRGVLDDTCAQGLYIDDFFAVSKEDASLYGAPGNVAKSTQVFRRAKTIYEKEAIAGSDDKDVCDSLKFKLAGAEIVTRQERM